MSIGERPTVAGRPQVRADLDDGTDLRMITFGGEQVAARLLFAVRDHVWRTPRLIVDEKTEVADGVGLRREVRAHVEGAPVEVRLSYHVHSDRLEAEVHATLTGSFRYNRIGFCLLLDDDLRRASARSTLGGATTDFSFPDRIITRDHRESDAVAFHRAFDGLAWTTANGQRVEAQFDGELFEFEDQRNWTDPSFKGYSVAPPGGMPVDGVAGERIRQRVTIRASEVPTAASARYLRLVLGPRTGEVPPISAYRGRPVIGAVRPAGGFQEFNARRPHIPPGGVLQLAVNGAVHAADKQSVMETTRMHGRIVEEARQIAPHAPVVLAPVGFLDEAGDWRGADGHYVAQPGPVASGSRMGSSFGSAWILASAATAVPAQPAAIHYLVPDGDRSPAQETIARLGALERLPVREARLDPPMTGMSALAVEVDQNLFLVLANAGVNPVSIELPDGRRVDLAALDAVSMWLVVGGRSRLT